MILRKRELIKRGKEEKNSNKISQEIRLFQIMLRAKSKSI